eukprot:3177774-Rhodomonas_salina.1
MEDAHVERRERQPTSQYGLRTRALLLPTLDGCNPATPLAPYPPELCGSAQRQRPCPRGSPASQNLHALAENVLVSWEQLLGSRQGIASVHAWEARSSEKGSRGPRGDRACQWRPSRGNNLKGGDFLSRRGAGRRGLGESRPSVRPQRYLQARREQIQVDSEAPLSDGPR